MRLYFLDSNGATYEERVTGLQGEIPPRPTFGERMPRDSFQLVYRCLEQDSTSAIFAVQITSGDDEGDLYVYLENGGSGWFIAAIRTLALTEIPQSVVNGVSDPSQLSVRERQVYENCRLLLSSDRKLKEYFLAYRKEFERLREILAADGTQARLKCRISFSDVDEDTAALSEGDQLLCNLNLNTAHTSESGVVEISVGGMVDNEVGYMFVPEGQQPPRMDSSRYIYVDRIVDRWFLFKTT